MRWISLAVGLLVAGTAWAEPSPLQAREALRRQWLGHALPQRAPGLRKPDDRGVYDLLQQRIELIVPPRGLPDRARFEVQIEVLADFGEVLPLAAISFEPAAVQVNGAPRAFERFPEGELLIELGGPPPVGEVISVTIEADLLIDCVDATSCIDQGPFRHLLELGWFPLSVEFPLTDRFDVSLSLEVEDGTGVSGFGANVGVVEGPGRRIYEYETEIRSVLAAFAVGDFQLAGEADGVQVFAPAGVPPAGSLLDLGQAVRTFYGALYQGYPFSRLAMTPISDDAGVAIGPQANIFLPASFYLFTAEDDLWPAIRQTVAHEIGHQYFFNLVGVLDAEEAWLSEAFAEYSATRFDAELTGTEDHRLTNAWTYLYEVPPELDESVFGEAVRANPFYFQIVYLKGSNVLHIFRQRLGPERFDEAMREYVAAFAGQLATTPEFQRSLESSLRLPLDELFEQWLRQPGYPTLRVRAEPARRDRDPVRFVVEQESPARPYTGPLPVSIDQPGGEPYVDNADLEGGEYAFPAFDGQRLRVDPELTVLRRIQPEPAGDVDLTGVVDGRDYLDVLFWQGLSVPEPAFDDQLDTNRDGRIDDADLRSIRERFGDGW